jgi:hypothetical protein
MVLSVSFLTHNIHCRKYMSCRMSWLFTEFSCFVSHHRFIEAHGIHTAKILRRSSCTSHGWNWIFGKGVTPQTSTLVPRYRSNNHAPEKEAWTGLPGETFWYIVKLGRCEVFVFRSIVPSQIVWFLQEPSGKKTLQFASIMGLRNNWGYWKGEGKLCAWKGKFLSKGNVGFTTEFFWANNETISVDRLHLSRNSVSSVGVETSLWAWWGTVRTPEGERNFSFPWPLIEVLLYFPGGRLVEVWIDLSLPSSAQKKNGRSCTIYSYACKWWTGTTFCTSLETTLHYEYYQ